MKANEGTTDRAIRILLGVIAIIVSFMSLGLMKGEIFGVIVVVLGAVMLITGFFGFCPAYRIVGLSTCSKSSCSGSCDCSKE